MCAWEIAELWWWWWFVTLFLKILDIELTLGTLFLSQTPSANNRSRISHAKIPKQKKKLRELIEISSGINLIIIYPDPSF